MFQVRFILLKVLVVSSVVPSGAAQYAEARQDDDVDYGMTEEPEEVLEDDDVSTGGRLIFGFMLLIGYCSVAFT